MEMASLALTAYLCIFCLSIQLSYASPSRLPVGAHPLDEKFYDGELIKCKDGSKSFIRDRLNDDFCDCADGTDEPGTSACPAGKFYCRNTGSIPRFLFSSRVNDRICDCCDGSDENDGTVICRNTCIMGGNIVYQRINYDSNLDSINSRKTKPRIKMEDSALKLRGLKALVFLQAVLVIGFVAFRIFRRRKTRRRNSR